MSEVEAVLAFWFGQLDESGAADAEHARRWFVKDDGFDREIRARFGVTHVRSAPQWLRSIDRVGGESSAGQQR